MYAIFAVTFPFFAIVLLGYLAAQRGAMPESAIPGLNSFVLFFALPCMLFRFGASRPFAQLIDPSLIGIYAVGALLMVVRKAAVFEVVDRQVVQAVRHAWMVGAKCFLTNREGT